MKKLLALMLALVMLFSLSACGSSSSSAKPEDAAKDDPLYLNSLTLEEIEQKAKEGGRLDTIGMPSDWCNWGRFFEHYTELYGIVCQDTDMSSSEQIALFEAEKDAPTKDCGEIGQQNISKIMSKGVAQAYKPSCWDKIPDWAKDEDGYWCIPYIGVISTMTNLDVVGKEITSFHDIADDLDAGTINYKVTIGDPTTESSSQHIVLAAAYAFGGDVSNLQPGIDFFRRLAEAGALDAGNNETQRYAKGESTVLMQWDYKNIQALENLPSDMHVSIHVMKDGAIASGYLSGLINRWAPHPEAAALARELIFSEWGQLNFAAAGATPTRTDIVVPEGTAAYDIPDEEYENIIPVVEFADDWINASSDLARMWEEEVVPYMA